MIKIISTGAVVSLALAYGAPRLVEYWQTSQAQQAELQIVSDYDKAMTDARTAYDDAVRAAGVARMDAEQALVKKYPHAHLNVARVAVVTQEKVP
jgi:hypothetical protein